MEFSNEPKFERYHTDKLHEILKEKQSIIDSTKSQDIVVLDVALLPEFLGESPMERVEKAVQFLKVYGILLIDSSNDKRTV